MSSGRIPALETYVLNRSKCDPTATAVPFIKKCLLSTTRRRISRAVPVANTADNPTCGSLAAFAPPSSGNGPCAWTAFSALVQMATANGSSAAAWTTTQPRRTHYPAAEIRSRSSAHLYGPDQLRLQCESKQPENQALHFNYTHVFNSRIANSFVGSVLHTSSSLIAPSSCGLSRVSIRLYLDDTSLTSLGEGAPRNRTSHLSFRGGACAVATRPTMSLSSGAITLQGGR